MTAFASNSKKNTSPRGKRGLFVGVTTLDCIYQADHPPTANEKIAADKSLLVAGGPATNAAVAFAQIGRHNRAALLSVIGEHSLTGIIREDLQGQGITLADLDPTRVSPPPVSSIVVSAGSGDRAVISRSAADAQATPEQIPPDILADVDVVLIDGHQMVVSEAIAQQAKQKQIPVVVDAGSWKPNFERVLALADIAIASANFLPPGCTSTTDVFAYFRSLGITKSAITRGAAPLLYVDSGKNDRTPREIEIPQIKAIDTLGAGDIFHGAFCHFHLTHTFEEALLKASRSASFACQHWGTRDWTCIYRITDDEDENEEETNSSN